MQIQKNPKINAYRSIPYPDTKTPKIDAYRSIPYQRQNPDENQGLRKNFKQAYKRQFPVNQSEEAHSDASKTGDEAEQSTSLNQTRHAIRGKRTKVRTLSYINNVID